MKKFTYVLSIALMAVVFLAGCKEKETTTPEPPKEEKEDFLASKTPSNQVAVLEDFTGVRCGYCPDGHVKAKAVADANPGKFIILAVHAGGYATPAKGWANFTTKYGNALISQSGVAGYPAGTINRRLCSELAVAPQKTGGIAMSRNSWAAAADKIMSMPAPVNIGAKATFNPDTRKLTIRVDMYYTAEETGANNLNVVLLQDHLFSTQSGAPNPSNYEQNHVVRDFITEQWGDNLSETRNVGAKLTRTYTYTVPADYNGTGTEGGGAVVIENLKVVAFVAQGRVNILNAVEVAVETESK